jgi:hypothetical protein
MDFSSVSLPLLLEFSSAKENAQNRVLCGEKQLTQETAEPLYVFKAKFTLVGYIL